MYRTPITTTHDENGYAHIILSMDEAQEILHAMETAGKVAPTEGGTPIAVAAASATDFYRWAGLFTSALGAINAGIAGCLDMPDKKTTAAQEEEQATAPQPTQEPADAVTAFWSLAQHYQATGVNVEKVARDAAASMTPAL